jgi:4-hydroxybenzoate polyprenyltransferase
MAELVLLVAVALVPLALGIAFAYARRPWWWGAVAAVAVFLVAAILPEPEEGESRVAAGDIAFLVIVAALVVGLVWLGAVAGRRLAQRRI